MTHKSLVYICRFPSKIVIEILIKVVHFPTYVDTILKDPLTYTIDSSMAFSTEKKIEILCLEHIRKFGANITC